MSSAQLTQVSLEAVLARAINPVNSILEPAAVEAFCALINKEKEGPQIGVKVLAARLPFGGEQEVLAILNMLDYCMPKCGIGFQNEVGKFRFLNEMIKLVSPKYLGGKTPMSVKLRVLELLYLWTIDYPKEVKIKEAFDMLRKQGVVKDLPNPNIPQDAFDRKKLGSSVFQDEEKSNILKKLLQSKDPEDIQTANWLIKSMVKEDEKLSDLKSKAVSELESVQNNLKLLNEMMSSYRKGVSTQSELDLMKELYDNCVRLRPNLTAIACESSHQCPEDLLENVLQTSDEVTEVLSKYHRIILLDKPQNSTQTHLDSLLQFDQQLFTDRKQETLVNSVKAGSDKAPPVDVLCDLLSPAEEEPENSNILKPVSVSSGIFNGNAEDRKPKNTLEDLDFLGDHLLKENLSSSNSRNEKIPMNLLCKINEIKQSQQDAAARRDESLKFDLDYLINKSNGISDVPYSNGEATSSAIDSSDDCLVDITEDKNKEKTPIPKQSIESNPVTKELNIKVKEIKTNRCDNLKLGDINVRLEDIKPSSRKSIIVLEEKNGISVLLHLAKDRPRPGISVYVVTTINKKDLPLSGYDFKAIVPKGCKLKLQPPSATDLPSFNPFLPPAAITQIMLIGSTESVKVTVKFVLSYIMDDENFTEMIEIEDLPLCEND